MTKFTDISKHQKGINIKSVVDSNNLSMVIIKATEGVGYNDPECAGYVTQVRSSGAILGFYHFGRPDFAENTAKNEAYTFINRIRALGVKDSDVLVLDYEMKAYHKNDFAFAKEFLGYVKKEFPKNKIWLYANSSYISSYNFDNIGYDLWVANYGPNNGKPNNKPGNSKMVAWQYTSVGRLTGYSGNLDLNECYIDLGSVSTGGGNSNNDDDYISYDEAMRITTGSPDGKKVVRVAISDTYINDKDTYGYKTMNATGGLNKYNKNDKNQVIYPENVGTYYGYLVISNDYRVWAKISMTIDGTYYEFYLDLSDYKSGRFYHNVKIKKLQNQSGL